MKRIRGLRPTLMGAAAVAGTLSLAALPQAAHAQASVCAIPHTRFSTAMAMVKSATAIDKSLTAGSTKRPRLWRRPMASDSMIDAPISMGAAKRSELGVDTRESDRPGKLDGR